MKKIEIQFSYRMFFRKTDRCRKVLSHEIVDKAFVEVEELTDKEFPLAGIYTSKSTRIEYRYAKDSFWVVSKNRLKALQDGYWGGEEEKDEDYDENAFEMANKKGTIVIEGNNRELRLNEVTQRIKSTCIYFNGKFWVKVEEPIAFIYDSTTSKGNVFIESYKPAAFHKEYYNVKDVDWNDEGYHFNGRMEVIMPEAFQYGYDAVSISVAVAKHVMKIWPRLLHAGWIAGKVLIKAMPLVVEAVKMAKGLPYHFSGDDIDKALSDVLEELLSDDKK